MISHDERRRPILHLEGGSPASSRRWVVSGPVILSDRTLREQLAAGRIVVDPLDESLIQPSSIDVRISNLFRVFRNHTRGVIDVKLDMKDLTELIEIPADEAFMLHPGEVLGAERLLDHVWDENIDPFTNTVRATISKLRKKLATAGLPDAIETIVGSGYRLVT